MTSLTGVATTEPASGQTASLATPGRRAGTAGNSVAFLDITGLTQEQIAQVQRELGQVTLPQSHDTWTLLRIPKSVFQLSGGGAGSWATVAAVRLTAQANSLGQVAVYWDDLKLQGGSGLQGTYKYQVVYFNSTRGTRSK